MTTRRSQEGTLLGGTGAPTAITPTVPPPPPPPQATFSDRTVVKRCNTCRLNIQAPEDGSFCPTCGTTLVLAEAAPSIAIKSDVTSASQTTPPTPKPASHKVPTTRQSPGARTIAKVMQDLREADTEGYRLAGFLLLVVVAALAGAYFALRTHVGH